MSSGDVFSGGLRLHLLLAILGSSVRAVLALIEQPEKDGCLYEADGADSELGEEDGGHGLRSFLDDLRGRGVEPFVGPAFEG